MSQSTLKEVEVKRGYWLYDGLIRKTVLISCLNYDIYFELEKDDGLDMSDESPDLNDKGESYLIRWPSKGFNIGSGSFSIGGLTLEVAIAEAERIVQQSINWVT